MRKTKFDNTKDAYESDDIKYAFQHNSLGDRLDDIDVIVSEVAGENDGYNWYWILQMKDGSFSWATGGCDYTGWDCQSHAIIHDGFKTAQEAWEQMIVSEYDSRNSVKKCMLAQLRDELPFGIYQEDYI